MSAESRRRRFRSSRSAEEDDKSLRERPSQKNAFGKLPSILLAILLLASPLLIGGVHFLSAAALAFLAILGLWTALLTSNTSPEGSKTPTAFLSIPTLAISAMAFFTLLQLLPLPTFLYKILQPRAYQALHSTWEIYAGAPPPPGWHFLSLDPAATAAIAMKWIALAAITALAAQVIRRRRDRTPWLGLILITAAVVALFGAIQHLSGTALILGFYQAEVPARSISPFVNPNHAASYYGLIALTALCFGYDKIRSSPLLASLSLGAALSALLLAAAHGSDGANLAILISLSALALGLLLRTRVSREMNPRWIRRAALGLLLIAALAAFFLPDRWTLSEEPFEEIAAQGSAQARLEMISAALHASLDHPFLGSGAGSVDRVIAPYLDWELFGSHSIASIENEPVEWVLTYGPLIALFTLFVFLLLLRRTGPALVDPEGRRGAAYAFALLLYLGIISMFHFPFFTLGVSAVALIAIEACLRQSRDGLHLRLSPLSARLFAAGLTVAALSITALSFTILAPGPEETLRLDDQEALERALRRYPTDARLLSALALRIRREGDPEAALSLAEHAFTLRPDPRQEFLLARAQAEAGNTDEAARIYGRLLDQNRTRTGMSPRVRERLPLDLPDPDDQALAIEAASDAFLSNYLRRLSDQQSPTVAIDVALALVALDPDRAAPHLELIELYRRADQPELAEIYARALINRNLVAPDGVHPAGLLELLDLFRRQDRLQEARLLARRAFDAEIVGPEIARAVLLLRPPQGPRAMNEEDRRLFQDALEIGCPSPYETARIQRLCWEARAYDAEARGDLDQARSLLTRIERHHGDPRPLAAMLARNGLCRELASLQRTHESSRFASHLQRSARDCARFQPEGAPD